MPAADQAGRARREVSAGGVVFRRTSSGPEFALIKATGRWSFPKGNIEKGETSEAAALREISEETGLPRGQLSIVGRLPDVQYVFRWRGVLVFKTVHTFLVRLDGLAPFEPQLSEIEEVQWFSSAPAAQALGFKSARETLKAAIGGIEAAQVAS